MIFYVQKHKKALHDDIEKVVFILEQNDNVFFAVTII